jgi:homoserine O-acetyltransferase/O-succinyltransferase
LFWANKLFAKHLLIPGSPDTAGHGATGQARFYKGQLAEFLDGVPKR